VSCNRIVLMRLINCACCGAVYGCFSYAPHMRRIGAGVARMNTCGGVWIAGVTQHSMKDLEGPRPPPRCLEDTLTISMRMKRPHTQQQLCSMTSLRAGAAGSSRRVCSSSQAANFASLRMGRSTSPCTMRQISCAWNSASVYALHHVENWLLCRCRSSY